MRCVNLLEPQSLLSAFKAHPPQGFKTLENAAMVPAFATNFDLLTTADHGLRRRVMSLPGYARWRGLLEPRTCFIGTTVTEYVPLPEGVEARALLRQLKNQYATSYPLLIIKDLPVASPLLPASANQRSADLLVMCPAENFVILDGQALAYLPLNFAGIEQYLAFLSRARRKDIRRKLRASEAVELTICSTGQAAFAAAELLAELYALYCNVYQQSELKFDLLSVAFFKAAFQDESSGGQVFLYSLRGKLIGFNLCFVHGNCLVDKYLGLRYPEALQVNLYFRSWIENIRFALVRGLSCYVVGWTDPQVKRDLGAQFTFTKHAVHVRNPLLRPLLRRIAGRFEQDRVWHEARNA